MDRIPGHCQGFSGAVATTDYTHIKGTHRHESLIEEKLVSPIKTQILRNHARPADILRYFIPSVKLFKTFEKKKKSTENAVWWKHKLSTIYGGQYCPCWWFVLTDNRAFVNAMLINSNVNGINWKFQVNKCSIDGLVPDCSISIGNALQSCTKPLVLYCNLCFPELISGDIKYICIFSHFSTLKWQRLLKYFLVQHNNLLKVPIQIPDEVKSQGISSHKIYQVLLEYSSFSMLWAKQISFPLPPWIFYQTWSSRN